jgi:hypothetical protein
LQILSHFPLLISEQSSATIDLFPSSPLAHSTKEEENAAVSQPFSHDFSKLQNNLASLVERKIGNSS